MYFRVYNLPITITRCANVFGPGDLNMNRIIPGVIEAMIKTSHLKLEVMEKWLREYIYVKDSIDAYIKLAENIQKTKESIQYCRA